MYNTDHESLQHVTSFSKSVNSNNTEEGKNSLQIRQRGFGGCGYSRHGILVGAALVIPAMVGAAYLVGEALVGAALVGTAYLVDAALVGAVCSVARLSYPQLS